MEVNVYWSWKLPKKVAGLVVVADVYAATTNIARFLGEGVKELWIVNSQTAAKTKESLGKALVIGESKELAADFFDATNFPWNNRKLEVSGEKVVFLSGNGTKVVEAAFNRGADEVVTVGFNNISAVERWLSGRKLNQVSLVASGERSFKDRKALEDMSCVQCLEGMIKGRKVDWKVRLEEAKEFIRSNYRSEEMGIDLEIILAKDRYKVVPGCFLKQEGLIRVRDMSKKVVK
jgi:phosphosulfolactate phosphohydrolase-like enzyme